MADFDLQITNVKTNKNYTDDETLIPKNAPLIISKIPLALLKKKAGTHQTDVKTGVSALSSTRSSFRTIAQQSDGVEESLKQAVLAEEEAVPNQYKAKVNSPVNNMISSVNNPFSVSSKPTVDIFSPVSATQIPAKASDDLLQFSNPLSDLVSTPKIGSSRKSKQDPLLSLQCDNNIIQLPVSRFDAIVNKLVMKKVDKGKTKDYLQTYKLRRSSNIEYWKEQNNILLNQALIIQKNIKDLEKDLKRNKRAQPQKNLLSSVYINVKITTKESETSRSMEMYPDTIEILDDDSNQPSKVDQSTNTIPIQVNQNIVSPVTDLVDSLEEPQKPKKCKPRPKSKTKFVDIENCSSNNNGYNNHIITDLKDNSNEKFNTVVTVSNQPSNVDQSTYTMPIQVNQNIVSPVIDLVDSLEEPQKPKKFKPGLKSKTRFVDTENCSNNNNNSDFNPFLIDLNDNSNEKLNTVVTADENIKCGKMFKPINESKSMSSQKINSSKKSMRNNFSMEPKYPPPFPATPKHINNPSWKKIPSSPILSIKADKNKILLSWDMKLNPTIAKIKMYELFGCQKTNAVPNPSMWKKIGEMKSKRLPMQCVLNTFTKRYNYYFALRAVDIYDRRAPFALVLLVV